MRGTTWTLKGLALLSLGLFACSSSQGISDGSLTFVVAEGLLELATDNPTLGTVVLSPFTGNCTYLQQGYGFNQVGGNQYLVFPLGQVDALGAPAPLTGGEYTVVDPSAPYNGTPTSIAYALLGQTNPVCAYNEQASTSGTVTVDPFNTNGAGSDVAFEVIFGNSRITGNYPLTPCMVDSAAPAIPDGGLLTCPPII